MARGVPTRKGGRSCVPSASSVLGGELPLLGRSAAVSCTVRLAFGRASRSNRAKNRIYDQVKAVVPVLREREGEDSEARSLRNPHAMML